MVIIEDCCCVARVQIPIDTLRAFLIHNEVNVDDQLRALSKREGVVVCFKNKVRVKRLSGTGWYQISGYREDGHDTRNAISRLRAAHIQIHGKG